MSAAIRLDANAAGADSTMSHSTPAVPQVGSVLIQEGVLLPDGLLLESDPYTVGWRAVRTINGFGVDQKIRSAGWNMFTIAEEFKTTVWGSTINGSRRGLIHVLAMVRARRFNSAEVKVISRGHLLGIPYTSVSVGARHIQHGYMLGGESSRAQVQRDTDWARS